MEKVGYTVLFVVFAFFLVIGLLMLTKLLVPVVRPLSGSLADVLENI